jgi:hypothetical protein
MTWDKAIVIASFAGGCFALGLMLGEAKPLPPVQKVCPVVQGQQVISTSSTREGEYCTYATSYGKAMKPRRV